MKHQYCRRMLSLLLAICMLIGMAPVVFRHIHVEAEAVGGIDALTCAGFISNSTSRKYIDTMMKYHLNTNSTLRNTLDNGKSVIFMFEGGSDNYPSNGYEDTSYDQRNQAVVIVVQRNASGNAEIVFYCEDCSSIPDDPDNCTGAAYSGATTIADGIYGFQTTNHTGPYGALNTYASTGYYTPPSNQNGYFNGCSGINIHTRTSVGSGGGWSLGCQVISYGNSSANEFNAFMKKVAGISYNVWVTYKSALYTITAGIDKGYYVLDRQLSLTSPTGVERGSGSLIEIYNNTALNNLTEKSLSWRNAAGYSLEYKDQCEKYASHCTLEVTGVDTQVRGAPCSEGTDPASALIEIIQPGKQVTAVGMYKNLYGNYWYEVLTSSGELGYIYSGNVKYVKDHVDDITLTGADTPDSHVKGSTFYVNGTIASKYNKLTSVSCYIYNGFQEKGTPVTGDSDTPTTNTYVLKGSTVDDNTWMGPLAVGNYTYTISASYINYYATDPTTIASNSGTLVLKDDFFVVISESPNGTLHSHNNTTYVLEESTCLTDGRTVTACSTCGQVTEKVTKGGHQYGDWVTTKNPTCVQAGVQSRTCSACKDVQTQPIEAGGHSYDKITHSASCVDYEREEYVCAHCGDSYFTYADSVMSSWSTQKPVGIAPDLIETRTEYRFSDLQTLTNSSASVDGYTQVGKEWVKKGSSTLQYVSEWPEGFLNTHALYSKFNVTPKSATETESQKITVESTGKLVGYVFYHWCYGTYTGGPINRTTSKVNDGTHNTFHAFEISASSVTPSSLPLASDGSVTYGNAACCTDSHWYYYFPIYEQSYTTYEAKYTHQRWTAYSDWSAEAVNPSETKRVEQRTMYRYFVGSLGDHDWNEGVCQVCGEVCEHTYQNRVCTVCGMAEPVWDYYLFGYINGDDYACETDYMNNGQYLFVDGKLVVTFQTDSYVGVKQADNVVWYLTDGYLGENTRTATLYNANLLLNPDKLYVPGRHEITFTLSENEDGSVTLSYEITKCGHNWNNGVCDVCGAVCDHAWNDGVCGNCNMTCAHTYMRNVCTQCGKEKPVKDYYLFGFINGADYGCEGDYMNLGQYKFVGGKLTATFEMDSYVALKSGDNLDWYMTNGWLGEEVTAATLYNTNTGSNEKLFVPGGAEITFTLIDNGNDTYLLTYVAKEPEKPTVTNPGLAVDYPSVSFESEILYNIYFTVENMTDVVEMGLVTFETRNANGTISDALHVYPGYSESDGSYMAQTEGVSAKNLGDAVYFKVYAKLSDGSYVYTDVAGYHAVAYAKSILKNSSNSYMKSLVVAMVNYGAEAQKYFHHNEDSLMNSFLTDAQKALVTEYKASMVNGVVAVDSTKAGSLQYNGSSFAKRVPTVSFDGAFAINYYFTTAVKPDSAVKLYYWTLEDYNAATTLSPKNASGSMTMTLTEYANRYWGQISGIAAKELDETVFVVGVYSYNGTTYSTGVLNYHIGKYCAGLAAKDTSDQQDLAKATAVYGYYAKEYFANL